MDDADQLIIRHGHFEDEDDEETIGIRVGFLFAYMQKREERYALEVLAKEHGLIDLNPAKRARVIRDSGIFWPFGQVMRRGDRQYLERTLKDEQKWARCEKYLQETGARGTESVADAEFSYVMMRAPRSERGELLSREIHRREATVGEDWLGDKEREIAHRNGLGAAELLEMRWRLIMGRYVRDCPALDELRRYLLDMKLLGDTQGNTDG
jgi:hypothetical protein